MANNYFVEAWIEPAPGVRRQEMLTLQEATNFGLDNNTQEVDDAGIADVDVNHIALHLLEDTQAATALTLHAPKRAGQMLVIECVSKHASSTGSYTIQLTNVVGGTKTSTASFDAVGEILVLVSASNKWVVLKEIGVTLTS